MELKEVVTPKPHDTEKPREDAGLDPGEASEVSATRCGDGPDLPTGRVNACMRKQMHR